MRSGVSVPQIPVLNYHHVHNGPDSFFRTSPELLARQMDLLIAEGFTPIGPSQLLALAGRQPDRRYAMVTFDDAYVDFMDQAWPILKSKGIPTTVFAISDYLGCWNEWDDIRRGPHRHLDAEALRQLHAEGVTIGSHSRTHPTLFRLWGSRLADELGGSRRALEEIVRAPVSMFAYPGGAQTWHVRRATRRVYDLGFATNTDRSGAVCDRYAIPRFEPCFCGDRDVFRRTLDEYCGFGR